MTLASSWSQVNRFSRSPSQSAQSRNFSRIHAASAAGESLSPYPSVCGRVDWTAPLLGSGLLAVGYGRTVVAGNVVEVNADDLLGMAARQPAADAGSEVAAMAGESLVAKLTHELGEAIGHARSGHA